MAETDSLHESLRRRVSELETENLNLKSEAKDRRLKNKKLAEENTGHVARIAALTTERDGFKTKAEGNAPELMVKVAELEGVIRTGKHRQAFNASVPDAAGPKALDDLWSLSGYKADSEEPDQAAIDVAIAAAREARPYLFKPAEASAEAVEPATPARLPVAKLIVPITEARGTAMAANPQAFKVTKSQSQDPAFMRDNQAKIAQAYKDGNLIMND